MSVTCCLNSILVCTCLEDLRWRNFIVFFKTVTWYPVKLPSIYLMAKTQNFFSKSHLIDPSMILIWHLHSEMWNPGYFYFTHLNAPYKKTCLFLMKWGEISDDLMMKLQKPKIALTQVMTNPSEGF